MLIERINEAELDFCEEFFNPVAFTECVFSTLHNLVKFDDELADVRMGQFPMLSYEYMLDYNPELNSKENFKLRENTATIYCYGGRRFGKTLIVEQVDILMSFFLLDGEHVGFSSLDALHIRGIIEKIIQVLRTHELFKILGAQINRSPNYRISLKNGYLFESVNMNIAGQTPGSGFFQKHFHRLYIEEGSFETDEVYNKRIDSVAEDGCIFRIAGMTNFTKYSPAGRTFFDLSKKRFVCNLPQFINPKWDFREKEKAIKENGGEMSAGYRVFVKGEVVEEGIAVFDMERVRACYNYEKQVKSFEINKDNFGFFKDILVLERAKNAEKVYVCADIGESAPTEIIIIYEVNGVHHYVYNIVAYRLDDKQQETLIGFVINSVQANIAGLDTTDGTGRAILRALAERYPKEQLVACSFNEKIGIDFERDPNSNRVVFDAGRPVLKEEYVSEWSVRRLKTLFYESKMSIPSDHKLDIQMNSVIATTSGLRTVYTVVSAEDHLFSAFRVFSICQWMHEFSVLKPLNSKKFDKVGC